MENVVIYGSGRQAELVSYYLEFYKLSNVVAFVVQEEFLSDTELLGRPLIKYKDLLSLYPPEKFKLFIAVGPQLVNKARENVYLDAKGKGYSFINCICPRSLTYPDLILGENVFIGPTTKIDAFVKIGNNVSLIDTRIGHHCQIDDHVFISASVLGGSVIVENNVVIGMGSTIGPNLTLGESSIIGMGSVISQSVVPFSVYTNNATTKRNVDSRRIKLI